MNNNDNNEMREAGRRFVKAAQDAAEAMQKLSDTVNEAHRRDAKRRRRAAERAKYTTPPEVTP